MKIQHLKFLTLLLVLLGIVWFLFNWSFSSKSKPTCGTNFTLAKLNLEMIWINPSTFEMGSPAMEPGRDEDEIQHMVTLTRGYWLGRYEVTQRQWVAMMGSNPSHFIGDLNRPVENINWSEAMAFCAKITKQERTAGRLPEGGVYTLPTEAQWEYACRAGTTGSYAGDIDKMACYYNNAKTASLNDKLKIIMGYKSTNDWNHTYSVGQKTCNAWGFYDMHGNVWEWCHDWYGDYASNPVTNPTGPISGLYRVVRGGGWTGTVSIQGWRSANRSMSEERLRFPGTGFRLCLKILEREERLDLTVERKTEAP